MEVHFAPNVEKKLNDLAAQSGRRTDEVLQEALAGYFAELVETRDMLNSRYDDLKSGGVKPIDGEDHPVFELKLLADYLERLVKYLVWALICA